MTTQAVFLTTQAVLDFTLTLFSYLSNTSKSQGSFFLTTQAVFWVEPRQFFLTTQAVFLTTQSVFFDDPDSFVDDSGSFFVQSIQFSSARFFSGFCSAGSPAPRLACRLARRPAAFLKYRTIRRGGPNFPKCRTSEEEWGGEGSPTFP